MQVKVYTKPESGARLKPYFSAYSAAWRTRWEMAMIDASARFRSNPNWAAHLDNEKTLKKKLSSYPRDSGLTQRHLDYMVAELRYYAKLQGASNNSGAKLSSVDMVWTIDVPQLEALAKRFKRHVVGVSEDFLNYGQVWPLSAEDVVNKMIRPDFAYVFTSAINPTVYSLFFDKSPILKNPISSPMDALELPIFGHVPGSHAAWKQAVRELNQRMAGNSDFIPINEEYLDKLDPKARHWLPADIHVNEDGSVDFKSYINNLHPGKYPDAYQSIAAMIAKCLPALEQVLTDLRHPRDLRVPYDLEACVIEGMPHPSEDRSSNSRDPGFDYEDAEDTWRSKLEFTMPFPDAFSEPSSRPLIPYSLRSKDLQVVVRMEEMIANPLHDSDYKVEWLGDGTASEQIIATAIYFYEMDNVSAASLRFREGISAVEIGSPIDRERINHLFTSVFGTRSISYFEQAVGGVKLKHGQFICYPNVYQHCYSGFYARDRSKVCRMKAFILHFVDPSVRIVSTSVVPPQQKEWWDDEPSQSPLASSGSLSGNDGTIDLVNLAMPFEQASEISRQLDKRSFKAENNFISKSDMEFGDDRFSVRMFNPIF